jgi:hypothetical protein
MKSKGVFLAAILTAVLCFSGNLSAYSGGTGDPCAPYQIANKDDLLTLAANTDDYDKCFILTADINMQGQVFTTAIIGAYSFTGSFDGNSHKITNFTISGGCGLFGFIDSGGSVKNLGIMDCNVSGHSYVGGLVGVNRGIINDCYSTGIVSSSSNSQYVGGLVGLNICGSISNCYSTGSVSGPGSSSVGGLVGENQYGSISNCYSTGSVSGPGSSSVGGLVGRNYDGSISNCYFLTTSGPYNGLGTPLTNTQMKQQSNFVGWDFINETINGTCNYWQISAGAYPVLSTFNGYIPPEPNGSGTSQAPYIIIDANGLGTIWYRPAANYILANDINLAGINWSVAVVPNFSGVFDGNGFCINNLSITGAGNLGLFGWIEVGSFVQNLSIKDCMISGSSGSQWVGGLVGLNNSGSISNCYSTGSVSGPGSSSVGGLVGENDGSISSCYSTSTVSGSSDYVGGLVGGNGDSISNCYSTGSVIGSSDVGGLVGDNGGDISNCYSTGSVIGSSDVGGLVGDNGGNISNCYSTGSVIGSSDVGGLVGSNPDNTITACFWDINTSSQTTGVGYGTSTGVTGKSTAEMKTQSTFTNAGWDFVGETANGTADIWKMVLPGIYYPKLVWEKADVRINLNGQYWFGSLSANSVGSPWCSQGTVTISGNNWVQDWNSPSGHHSLTTIFATSVQPDGSVNIIFPSNTYNIAWNGNVMIHDGNVIDGGLQGIDIFTRKATDVDVNDVIGSYSFYGHWLSTISGGDETEWGDSNFYANGTLDVNWVNSNGYSGLDTGTWTLDDVNAIVNASWGTAPLLLGKNGINTVFRYNAGSHTNIGYNVLIKKTSQTITPAEMAGKYQVRFLQTAPGGIPYTCYPGTCTLGADGSFALDAYYTDGTHDVHDGNYTIGFGNKILVNVHGHTREGTISSPDLGLIFFYGDARPNPPDPWDWIGGLFMVRTPVKNIADLNGDGIVNFVDYAIFASAWLSRPGQSNWNPACDFSYPQNNIIDCYDLDLFADNWLVGF